MEEEKQAEKSYICPSSVIDLSGKAVDLSRTSTNTRAGHPKIHGKSRIFVRTFRQALYHADKEKKVVILSLSGLRLSEMCIFVLCGAKEGKTKPTQSQKFAAKAAVKKTNLSCQIRRIATVQKNRKSSQKQKFQSKAAGKKSIVRNRRRIADNSGRRTHPSRTV